MIQNTTDKLREMSVLYAEDDPCVREQMSRLLRRWGATVHEACNGEDALEQFQECRPDVVITDILMPVMDGLELAAAIKGIDDEFPIIVTTAVGEADALYRAFDVGVDYYVTKPVRVDRLLKALHRSVSAVHSRRQLLGRFDALDRQNHLLSSVVEDRTRELLETRFEIIHTLGRAAELRDNETGAHLIRMASYSRLLAHAAGLGEASAELIFHAAPMHDVGKIGIPDEILLKPGALTAEEFQVMRTHTTIGAQILSGHHSDLISMARLLALNHHERMDGEGYPARLVGEEIPLEARIVAIADVFDALTSRRPYKEAWTAEQAFSQIREEAGSHFDPRLVALFLGLRDDVLKIMMRHPG